MSDTVIKVENLSKKYILSHQRQERYTALRDVMASGVKQLGKKLFSPFTSHVSHLAASEEEFFALKDVSFEIEQGDRVGIIGRNGAGKSTLLKILSRITEPTTGRIEITGRVASLLEVGTGFHPELTGRENIYLNGAILGMGRVEIKRKFDEIVDFAEVEKFLDTPVKRYSSGMYVRLAFAVAAHLEPEILVVDEVLAVGDAQFQKKCLGKMGEVGKEGRTVLFVSHNMAAIQILCNKIIYLKNGNVCSIGDVTNNIKLYLSECDALSLNSTDTSTKISDVLELRRLYFNPNPVISGTDTHFYLELISTVNIVINEIVLLIYSSLGSRIAIIDLRKSNNHHIYTNNPFVLKGNIKSIPLVEGDYNIGLYISTSDISRDILDICQLTVISKSSQTNIVPYSPTVRGYLELDCEFSQISSDQTIPLCGE